MKFKIGQRVVWKTYLGVVVEYYPECVTVIIRFDGDETNGYVSAAEVVHA